MSYQQNQCFSKFEVANVHYMGTANLKGTWQYKQTTGENWNTTDWLCSGLNPLHNIQAMINTFSNRLYKEIKQQLFFYKILPENSFLIDTYILDVQ